MALAKVLNRAGENDFSECENEPIHAPGTIQSIGSVLVVDKSGYISAVSSPIVSQLKTKVEDILGRSWLSYAAEIGLEDFQSLGGKGHVTHAKLANGLNAFGHEYQNWTVWELEPDGEACLRKGKADKKWQSILSGAVKANIPLAGQAAVEAYRERCGYDRVMLYRFHADWSGEVLAEAKDEKALSFLGLRYPATDIPPQVRALFLKNPTRVIVDVNAPEAVLVQAKSKEIIDCSLSRLRGTSPYHLQYLRNMGVKASIANAIIVNGQLWGMLVGHHNEPHHPGQEMREVSETIAKQLAELITKRETAEHLRVLKQIGKRKQELKETLQNDSLSTVLRNLIIGDSSLQDMLFADGTAVVTEELTITTGDCPDDGELAEIVNWIGNQSTNPVVTNKISETVTTSSGVCGVLGAKLLVQEQPLFIILFRNELLQQVCWGGDPSKPISRDARNRLHPRESFDAWRETVCDSSKPWDNSEVLALNAHIETLQEHLRCSDGLKLLKFALEEFKNVNAHNSDLNKLLCKYALEGIVTELDKDSKSSKVIMANSELRQLLNIDPQIDLADQLNDRLSSCGLDMQKLAKTRNSFECWTPKHGPKQFVTRCRTAFKINSPSCQRYYKVINFYDVTSDRRALEAMTIAHDKAQMISEAQNDVLVNLSHEMRTPLNGVIGLSDIILAEDTLPYEEVKGLVKSIKSSGKHLLDIVSSILELADIDPGQLSLKDERVVNIKNLIGEVTGWVKILAENNHVIVSDIEIAPETPLNIRISPRSIRQVIINLMTNAVKYSPANAKIGCKLSLAVNGGLKIVIWDTGIGIPENQLKKIFTRFHRVGDPAAGSVEGSGLGLDLVKTIVDIHGGTVEAKSQVQRGTTITVTLPPSRVVKS